MIIKQMILLSPLFTMLLMLGSVPRRTLPKAGETGSKLFFKTFLPVIFEQVEIWLEWASRAVYIRRAKNVNIKFWTRKPK